nr:L-threonylcarbamoyladenylate synthase [Lentibacillus saliphilus]
MSKQMIQEAATMLRAGFTVAFPTETVYGLGADATNETAVNRIFEAKGRPADNPLIAHVATKEQLMRLVEPLTPLAQLMIDTFAPGPITFVLKSNGTCATNVTAGLQTIGVRLPEHPIAHELLQACDVPIAAPSANTSGKPSPTAADHVWTDLNGRIDGLLDGGTTGIGLESTVVDCTEDIPIILRPGAVTREQIEAVVGHVMIDPALLRSDSKPKAPGMKYTHYAPDVPLWLVEGSVKAIQDSINEARLVGKKVGLLACDETVQMVEADRVYPLGTNIQEVAAHLYDGLRDFKRSDVDLILCETFSEEGLGGAVMNRLRKAAQRVINSATE